MSTETVVVFQKSPMSSSQEYLPHGLTVNIGATGNSILHNHRDIEFKYILNNNGSRVIIGNNEYIPRKGDFLTANGSVPHAFFVNGKFDYVTLIFATELWFSFGVDAASLRFAEFVRDSVIDGIMETIVKEHREKKPFYKFRVNNCISNLVIHMMRNHTVSTVRSLTKLSQAQLNIANGVNEFLAQNYSRRLSIDNIAAALGFNKSYMMRTYKKVTSMTILEKLYTLRCNRATEELYNKKRTIAEIAYLSGFESPSHFGKIYKSFTGMSPSEYRKK